MIKKFINKSVVGILLLASSIVSNYAIAEERTSISFGQLSKNITTDSRLAIAKENTATSIVDQDIGKATGKTRAEILKSKTNKPSKATSKHRYRYTDHFTLSLVFTSLQLFLYNIRHTKRISINSPSIWNTSSCWHKRGISYIEIF